MRNDENRRFEAGVVPLDSALAQSLWSRADHDRCHLMAVCIASRFEAMPTILT